jgi:hypothetical protein
VYRIQQVIPRRRKKTIKPLDQVHEDERRAARRRSRREERIPRTVLTKMNG